MLFGRKDVERLAHRSSCNFSFASWPVSHRLCEPHCEGLSYDLRDVKSSTEMTHAGSTDAYDVTVRADLGRQSGSHLFSELSFSLRTRSWPPDMALRAFAGMPEG